MVDLSEILFEWVSGAWKKNEWQIDLDRQGEETESGVSENAQFTHFMTLFLLFSVAF